MQYVPTFVPATLGQMLVLTTCTDCVGTTQPATHIVLGRSPEAPRKKTPRGHLETAPEENANGSIQSASTGFASCGALLGYSHELLNKEGNGHRK